MEFNRLVALATLASAVGLLPSLAQSQELRIGHLETADDQGINWLFYHCNQTGRTLKCDVFQTLIFEDRTTATCSVMNDYSAETFTWNQPTKSWISQEGPIGECGRITIGTLSPDQEVPRFWRYTMRKLNTKPDGVLPNGASCKQAPEMTLNYTWRATKRSPGCTHLTNLMN